MDRDNLRENVPHFFYHAWLETMANKNGLVGGIPVFRDGTKPIWASVDNSEFDQITVTDGTDSTVIDPSSITLTNFPSPPGPAYVGIIDVTGGGLMRIQGPIADGMAIYPSGITRSGIQFQSPSGNTSMVIQALDNGDQLICSAIKGFNAITGTGTSGTGMSSAFSGVMNWVTVTTAGSLTIQFQGSNCVAGTLWEFVLNPASFAGATVTFNNGSTVLGSFTPSTAVAGNAVQVRVFTPDGTTFFIMA